MSNKENAYFLCAFNNHPEVFNQYLVVYLKRHISKSAHAHGEIHG
jgi:hypothetical protein